MVSLSNHERTALPPAQSRAGRKAERAGISLQLEGPCSLTPPSFSPKPALHYEIMFQSLNYPTSSSVASFPTPGTPENREWDGIGRN